MAQRGSEQGGWPCRKAEAHEGIPQFQVNVIAWSAEVPAYLFRRVADGTEKLHVLTTPGAVQLPAPGTPSLTEPTVVDVVLAPWFPHPGCVRLRQLPILTLWTVQLGYGFPPSSSTHGPALLKTVWHFGQYQSHQSV